MSSLARLNAASSAPRTRVWEHPRVRLKQNHADAAATRAEQQGVEAPRGRAALPAVLSPTVW